MERGQPIDRYYIDKFLEENRADIKGICLEIRDNRYTGRYGANIEKADVLDIDKSNPDAAIYGDLRSLGAVKNNSYDCIILTQTLQYIDDLKAAVSECYRILKPGGVILATAPTMSRIDPHAEQVKEFWRFTEGGLRYIFEQSFSPDKVRTGSYGNIATGLGFWIGQAAEELTKKELNRNDSDFPVLTSIKATK